MSRNRLLAPTLGTGVCMVAYLLLRPYGDAAGGETLAAAQAFASPAWVAAHLFGVLAIASFARLCLRLSDEATGLVARVARWSSLAGVVLTLPYYGAETFGLHAVGTAVLAGDHGAAGLVDQIRNHPAALTMFGLGLLLLAVSGIALALAWQRARGSLAAWPHRSTRRRAPPAVLPAAGRPHGLRRDVRAGCPPPRRPPRRPTHRGCRRARLGEAVGHGRLADTESVNAPESS